MSQRYPFLIWQSSWICLWLLLTYKSYNMSYNEVEKISSTKYCTKNIIKEINISHLSSTRQKLYNSFSKLISFCLWNITYFSLSCSPCSQVSSFQNRPSFEILHSVSSLTKQWVINTNIYHPNTEIFISIEIIQLQTQLLFSSYYCLFIWRHI